VISILEIFFVLQQRRVEWQQEVYSQFKYKEPRDQFHTFEADVSNYTRC